MTEGLDRFAELKRLAAETFGAPTDNARVELAAAVRLAFERQVEAPAANQRIDFTAFAKIVELLDKHAPPPPLPEVKLTIVHKTYDTLSLPPPETSTSEAAKLAATPTAPPTAPAVAAPAAKVTPLPTRLGVSGSGFHDWTAFSSDDKRHCVAEATMGGDSSYTELLTCLEMARDVRALHKNPNSLPEQNIPPAPVGHRQPMSQ